MMRIGERDAVGGGCRSGCLGGVGNRGMSEGWMVPPVRRGEVSLAFSVSRGSLARLSMLVESESVLVAQ